MRLRGLNVNVIHPSTLFRMHRAIEQDKLAEFEFGVKLGFAIGVLVTGMAVTLFLWNLGVI